MRRQSRGDSRLTRAKSTRPSSGAFVAALALYLFGCGTHVKTGDNLERSRVAADPASGDATETKTPTGAEARRRVSDGKAPDGGGDAAGAADGDEAAGNDGSTDGAGGGGAESGNGDGTGGTGGGAGTGAQALTCFGESPTLRPGFQAFCDDLKPELRQIFAASYDLICNQKRLVNLILRPCSWNGASGATSDKFRRVLAKTDIADVDTKDFSFLAAYGMTSESTPEEHVALILREMTDPNYATNFVTIRNSRLHAITPRPEGGFDYSVEFASSAATVAFRAALYSEQFAGGLTAVYDYAISDEVLVKEHRFLRLIVAGDEGTSRIIAIDEKLISDGGNHQVAYQNLTDVLKQRMERDYENSRRD